MIIKCEDMDFKELNHKIRHSRDKKIVIENCIGQRYIGDGVSDKELVVHGIPGNGLGAYLDGGKIRVYGNGQDAIGDTMNDGEIVIHGSCGDAPGYAMRGGRIFIKENAGYRTGIHMKAYKENIPVIIIGGNVGSFLGEYQAGGHIVVLGMENKGAPPVGFFCGTGMHGGKIFLRCDFLPFDLPKQVIANEAGPGDLAEIDRHLSDFCREFDFDKGEILSKKFYVLTPNTKNPYKQLYVHS